MKVRRVVGLVLACGLAVGSLVGCQEAEPTPKMSETTAASPSPSASAKPDRESAKAFIRRWQKSLDDMQTTGDTAEYVAMSRTCEPCQGVVEVVEDVFSKGGHIEFAGSSLTKLVRVGQTPPTFELTKDVPETVIHHADGEIERYPAGTTSIQIKLGRADGSWTVLLIGIL